jgi:hypothetical protein
MSTGIEIFRIDAKGAEDKRVMSRPAVAVKILALNKYYNSYNR